MKFAVSCFPTFTLLDMDRSRCVDIVLNLQAAAREVCSPQQSVKSTATTRGLELTLV